MKNLLGNFKEMLFRKFTAPLKTGLGSPFGIPLRSIIVSLRTLEDIDLGTSTKSEDTSEKQVRLEVCVGCATADGTQYMLSRNVARLPTGSGLIHIPLRGLRLTEVPTPMKSDATVLTPVSTSSSRAKGKSGT